MKRSRVILGLCVLLLTAIGFVVLSSAGGPVGLRLQGDNCYFVKQQAKWLALSLPLLMGAIFFDYRKWREWPYLTVLLYLGMILLLSSVFAFREINGSQRWIILGPVRIQPSEFAKIGLVIAVSVFLDKSGWRIELFWKGAVRAALLIALPMGLVLCEPDFGAAMVLALTGGILMFIGGMRRMHMAVFALVAVMAVGTLLFENPNRMRRIAAWMPEAAKTSIVQVCPSFEEYLVSDEDAVQANHQLVQALVAIRNGGDTGVGFGNSMQKQLYLPENHTDFIFAIGAEEWGIGFSLLLLALFVTVFICGVVISFKACDRLGRLMAFGMTFLLFFQVLFNIGVVTGILPTKGIALPFISYGGTNLMTALMAIGVIINVSRRSDLQRQREKSKISAVFHIQ